MSEEKYIAPPVSVFVEMVDMSTREFPREGENLSALEWRSNGDLVVRITMIGTLNIFEYRYPAHILRRVATQKQMLKLAAAEKPEE